MTVVSISARRLPRAALLTLAVMLVLAALAALAYAAGAPVLALLLALVIAAPLLASHTYTRRRAPVVAEAGAARQLTVQLEDGAVRQAILVPAVQGDGGRLALTADGYVLLDDAGRVIYRLGARA
jgi:hypothetical protein